MKIFPCGIIKELDAYTIENEPIASVDLMERAAQAVVDSITSQWNRMIPVVIFAGPGNNGGDALAIARLLAGKEYQVEVFLFNPNDALSEDCRINKERLKQIPEVVFTEVNNQFVPPALTREHLVIDGLFGSGLNKPLSGGFAAVVKYINASPATVVSIDIPSGLMGEENQPMTTTSIIHANYTFSFQLPKLAFLFAENAEYVGRWRLLDIGISEEAINETETDYFLTEEKDIRPLIRHRKKFAHKGNFGHAMLIAGSYGMAGASVLAARACLRSGVGLLTVHAPVRNNDILQTTVPEAMVEIDIHEDCFAYPTDTDNYDAVGIGPGLGQSTETASALINQIRMTQCPMVIDADALNLLSLSRQTLTTIPKGSILTPHPKELERLVGKSNNSYEQLVKACALAQLTNAHIIVKGAYTVVVTPEGQCHFNSTGNPGMATAGSGDVLTGIILALLAQGYTAAEASRIGVFVHGMAGDLARMRYGVIALNANDIIEFLPAAWRRLE